jgi:flagellar hook-associated protein 3 FlgL
MTVRFGDLAHANRMTSLLATTQQRIRQDQIAVSTGRQAHVYADVADRVTTLIGGKAEQTMTANQIKENDHTLLRMRAMDGALGNLSDGAERFRSLLVQRINAATGQDLPFVSEVDSLLADVASQLNLQLDSRYLFAGSRTDARPVQIPSPPPTSPNDTAAYYSGDSVKLATRAEDGVMLEYGVTADNPAFGKLIAALGVARAAHTANDTAGLESALAQMGDAIDSLAAVRGGLGSSASRLETITDSQRQTMLYLEDLVGSIESADLATAVTRISKDTASLEASYLTISRLNSLSLADYLR